jgi:TRAP-type uncharacterized transport system fused permease subunit
MLSVFGFAVVGVYAIAAALQGCMEKLMGPVLRIAALAAGFAALWPGLVVVNLVGVAATIALLIWNVRTGVRPAPASIT